jgi:hypothetical protein
MTSLCSCGSPTIREQALNGYTMSSFWYNACTNMSCPMASARNHCEVSFQDYRKAPLVQQIPDPYGDELRALARQ